MTILIRDIFSNKKQQQNNSHDNLHHNVLPYLYLQKATTFNHSAYIHPNINKL